VVSRSTAVYMMLGGCAPGWFPAWIVLYFWDKFVGPESESDEITPDVQLINSRENDFEFLAGNLEEDYPQKACRANGTATKY